MCSFGFDGFRLMYLSLFIILFFFKQKTAYEMRISDWSSDVCSSDLARFGIEQELTRRDDLLAGCEPPQYLGLAAAFAPSDHFGRMIATVALLEHHDAARAGADHRFARHQQRRFGIAAERYRREHSGAETPAAIGEFNAHRQSPTVGGRRRQDRHDPAGEALAGKGGKGRRRPMADVDQTEIGRAHV